MENLADYSHYVMMAYAVAALTLGSLFIFVITKYFSAKSKIKNEK